MGSPAGGRTTATAPRHREAPAPAPVNERHKSGPDGVGPAGRLSQADLVRWSLLRLPDARKR